MAVGSTTSAGWFNSWDWISSYNWLNGVYKSNDPFIHDLMGQFYKNAISKFIGNRLPKILEVQSRFSLKPEPPDLWFIGNNKKHHFIEVKRGNDKPSDEQLFGLLLIHVFLGYNIHLVWLYEEGTKQPSLRKISKYIEKFNALKLKLFDVLEGN